MKDTIKNFELGDFHFHVYSIETENGNVRGIEISDAFAGTEKIGFNEKISITFTDSHLIEDKNFKRKNEKNINNLKEMCELILNEINNSKQK